MTLKEFIDKHRKELAEHITYALGKSDPFDVDDDEIERWITNDEALYNWALSEGVDV